MSKGRLKTCRIGDLGCRKQQGPPKRTLRESCDVLRVLPSLCRDDLHLDLRAAREVLPSLRPGIDLDQVAAGLDLARGLRLPGDRDAAALLDLLVGLDVLADTGPAGLGLLSLSGRHPAVHPPAPPGGRA